MIRSEFQELTLSRLGFGAMRLPLVSDQPNAPVDEEQVAAMVDYALSHGVNYFDTAWPYHSGQSERVMGRVLNRHPRDSFYLADKFPGHQIAQAYHPEEIFEEQLKKCGVDFFDFYLLHNVYENSIKTYTDPQWGIVDYFTEQKRLGRIRHLGFSCHGGLETLRQFLDLYGDVMEFCQLQINYLDWTLQDAKAKYELVTERGIPVWVMEPVRGGRLARLPQGAETRLRALRPEESIPAWAFRWLQGLPNVKMILSGMSNMEQMVDNVHTFREEKPLTEEERALLAEIAEGLKNSLPCTACRYCCDGCPVGLDIPMLLSAYNDTRFSPSFNTSMRIEALPEDKRPSACVGCGKCAQTCPQKIDIPKAMKEFSAALAKLPSWAELCRQRDAAQQ
ncbi:MAG: aldo/keto reductase [Candidatus Enterenecus sp.]